MTKPYDSKMTAPIAESGSRNSVLVSACLLGKPCRYDGQAKPDNDLEQELKAQGVHVVPFCPEERGGLSTPRPKAWIDSLDANSVLVGKAKVVTENGLDVTTEFKAGAQLALEECLKHSISSAYLKERSPSCGVMNTHVNGQRVEGPGITSALLLANGIQVQGR